MTRADDIRIQAVSPVSTLGGTCSPAKAVPTVKILNVMNGRKAFFIGNSFSLPPVERRKEASSLMIHHR